MSREPQWRGRGPTCRRRDDDDGRRSSCAAPAGRHTGRATLSAGRPGDALRNAIERLDVAGVACVLRRHRGVAAVPLPGDDSTPAIVDPLHWLIDCSVGNTARGDAARAIARELIAGGASREGDDCWETPLLAAASLGVESVADVLVESGARTDPTCPYGATALHWAAYTGLSGTVTRLLARGAAIDERCLEYGATALHWATYGFSRYGCTHRRDQLGAAAVLLGAGANAGTTDRSGTRPHDLAVAASTPAMTALLARYRMA